MFEGRHIDYRSSKVDTSITDLRRSTHRSSKVNTSISEGDTSIFESRHIDLPRSTHHDIDLRRATHRSSKGDTSIFESRHIDLRKSTHRSSKIEGGNITPTIRLRILSTTALQTPLIPLRAKKLAGSRAKYTARVKEAEASATKKV